VGDKYGRFSDCARVSSTSVYVAPGLTVPKKQSEFLFNRSEGIERVVLVRVSARDGLSDRARVSTTV
jgi:hypothetical protein